MKKQLNQRIPLELIDLSGGCQQRKICPETIKHYIDLMKDGVIFPPVEVVWDGKVNWLWDGFHRFKCAQDRGDKTILANVETAGKRRAVFLSFSANSKHGVPRDSGAASYIIRQIYKDKEWSEMGVTDIAAHIGCSRQLVYSIKGKKDESKPETQKKDTKKAAEKPPETEPKAPIEDYAGNIIPKAMAERFIAKQVIVNRINELDGLKNAVNHSIEDGQLTYALLNHTAFLADYKTLRARLKSAMPYAICVYCKGKGCAPCHNMGFLNKNSYEAAPKNG